MQDDDTSREHDTAHHHAPAERVDALNSVNLRLTETLKQLSSSSVEDEHSDTLVSNLQELVERRQLLLAELVADTGFVDSAYLQQQLALSQSYGQQLSELSQHRQSLLRSGTSNQRHIQFYKTIDSNR